MKPIKKLQSVALILLSMLILFASCSKSAEEVEKEPAPTVPDEEIVEYDDKYKNFYEIFVRSFYDSDDDGYGDLNGLSKKLDYLKAASGADNSKSLGINGIWLMPICPSPSYHKYDITDYCAVDEMYGTIDDFEALADACEERGITLIIDMVFNHTSSEHEWFKMFCDVLKCEAEGKTSEYDPKYKEYYTYVTEAEKKDGTTYKQITGTDYYYECNFSEDMPELNYDSEYVWEEIYKICDFWIDKGVDGFRFDAVLYFYYNDNEKSAETLGKIIDYCKSKKSDFYTIGEAWTSSLIIEKYYNSGIDSLFNFPYANSNGYIPSAIKKGNGDAFAKKIQNWNNSLELVSATDAIDAPFISNHDMYRSSGYFQTLSQRKMAASLYQMMPGNTFIYYGEEIGLHGTSSETSQKDPTARTPIKWSAQEDGTNIIYPPNADTALNQDDIDGVKEQFADKDSLLNHYRLLLKLKNQNPQIARGTVKACDFNDEKICAYICVYDGVAVMVIHNIGLDEKSFDLSNLGYSDFTELRGYVVSKAAEGETETDSAPVFGASSEEEAPAEEEKEAIVTLSNGKLVIPSRTTVVLRSTEHYDDIVVDPNSITVSEEDSKVQGMNE